MTVQSKTLSAKEIIKKHYKGTFANTRLVKYGKITRNIVFEVRQNNAPYTDYTSQYLFVVEYCPETNTTEGLKEHNLYGVPQEQVQGKIQELKELLSK